MLFGFFLGLALIVAVIFAAITTPDLYEPPGDEDVLWPDEDDD
jgi:hypothetical protein